MCFSFSNQPPATSARTPPPDQLTNPPKDSPKTERQAQARDRTAALTVGAGVVGRGGQGAWTARRGEREEGERHNHGHARGSPAQRGWVGAAPGVGLLRRTFSGNSTPARAPTHPGNGRAGTFAHTPRPSRSRLLVQLGARALRHNQSHVTETRRAPERSTRSGGRGGLAVTDRRGGQQGTAGAATRPARPCETLRDPARCRGWSKRRRWRP